MKRRRRGGGAAAPQAETCGVWLDAAELKRSPAQSLTAKPGAPSRALEGKHAWVPAVQARAAQPRTKQTTIATFFSRRTDEKDKENARPSAFKWNKDCKEKGTSLAAFPVKILALPQMEEAHKQPFRAEEETGQTEPRGRAQTAPASPTPSPDSWLLQAESHSQSGSGEDCGCFSFTQDSEGNRIIVHRHESVLFAGETVSASGCITAAHGVNKGESQWLTEEASTGLDVQPGPGAKQREKPHPRSSVQSLTDLSETENINPAVRRGSTWATGFSSPQSPAAAQPLREHSRNTGASPAVEGWGSPRRQLFTQDSEGNRVIAHRCQHVPASCRNHSSSPSKGCSSDAAERSVSKSGEPWLDECYDLLFTQDSQGNRVIKHC